MLIQRGNAKLGAQIHTFSLPAGTTCPGESPICASKCYATKGFFRMPSAQNRFAANYTASRADDFVTVVTGELRQKKSTIVRIHVSGDFYNAKYVRKWIAIAEAFPDVKFYAYTRSWRVRSMIRSLEDFSDLENAQLWWSIDADTEALSGRPPEHFDICSAYMQVVDEEEIPVYADLVFRTERKTVVKFTSGCLVCLAENGMTYPKHKMTCKQCKLCFAQRAIPHKACAVAT
jgi:hypothetical protein